MEIINCFFLPFAGGNRYSYKKFEQIAPPFLNMIPLEYPGRGARTNEHLLTNVIDIVNDIYRQIKKILPTKRYIIFGHSMGGLVGYILAKKIVEAKLVPPIHIFITGTTGPSAPREEKIHLMNKMDFLSEIRNLRGVTEEIIQNQELVDYFEPILRADFKASETFKYIRSEPLDVPFTVITGTEEDMKVEDVHLWQKETKYPVEFKMMSGNHFFILQCTNEIIELISRTILCTLDHNKQL